MAAHEYSSSLLMFLKKDICSFAPLDKFQLFAKRLQGRDLPVYGDGSQTRSFCYGGDEIRGILALLDSNERGPINIGNPVEFTMLELAELVLELTGSQSKLV